jgi:hypothetical protein
MAGHDESGMRDTIARLQSVMLESVLTGQPLPGSIDPLWFPDLAWVTEAPSVLVSAENIPDPEPFSSITGNVIVTPEAEIRDVAKQEGDRTYVHFTPPETSEGRIRLTMEVRMAPTEPDLLTLGLGGITATFVESNGSWVVGEPPAAFAS